MLFLPYIGEEFIIYDDIKKTKDVVIAKLKTSFSYRVKSYINISSINKIDQIGIALGIHL